MFITDDRKHDCHAVHIFVTLANRHLVEKCIQINREIHLADGCSCQYKSHGPFCDLSYSIKDFGFPRERHFYGARHGKGPSDGEGAVRKSHARRCVLGHNIVINNANGQGV